VGNSPFTVIGAAFQVRGEGDRREVRVFAPVGVFQDQHQHSYAVLINQRQIVGTFIYHSLSLAEVSTRIKMGIGTIVAGAVLSVMGSNSEREATRWTGGVVVGIGVLQLAHLAWDVARGPWTHRDA
jgi:hypothetical protein